MLNFPKDDDFFENDKSLKSLIKTLEGYIEILFEIEGVLNAICALKECSSKKQDLLPIKFSQEEEANIAEIWKSLQPLIDDYEKKKDPVQKMRDDLWGIRNALGIYSTLMFINPHLVSSLEMLFSGAIITYSKAFNSSQGRTVLNCQKILGGRNELLDFHNWIIELRNKHFAHSEFEYNKHVLKYFLTEEKNINIEISSHTHSEFWNGFDYGLFFELINKIKNYLNIEINSKAATIKSRLSPYQLKRLEAETQQ